MPSLIVASLLSQTSPHADAARDRAKALPFRFPPAPYTQTCLWRPILRAPGSTGARGCVFRGLNFLSPAETVMSAERVIARPRERLRLAVTHGELFLRREHELVPADEREIEDAEDVPDHGAVEAGPVRFVEKHRDETDDRDDRADEGAGIAQRAA